MKKFFLMACVAMFASFSTGCLFDGGGIGGNGFAGNNFGGGGFGNNNLGGGGGCGCNH